MRSWGADLAREKPTARQNRSPWLPLDGIRTVGDLTLNDFDWALPSDDREVYKFEKLWCKLL